MDLPVFLEIYFQSYNIILKDKNGTFLMKAEVVYEEQSKAVKIQVHNLSRYVGSVEFHHGFATATLIRWTLNYHENILGPLTNKGGFRCSS